MFIWLCDVSFVTKVISNFANCFQHIQHTPSNTYAYAVIMHNFGVSSKELVLPKVFSFIGAQG